MEKVRRRKYKIDLLTAGDSWGGTECVNSALATKLTNLNHEVRIITFGDEEIYKAAQKQGDLPEQVEILSIPRSVRKTKGSLKHCISKLRICRNRLCILSKGSFDTFSWQIAFALRLISKRLISIEHSAAIEPLPKYAVGYHFYGTIPGLGLWWLKRYIPNYLLPVLLPHKIICVSCAVKNTLETVIGIKLSKAIVIHNGVNTSLYDYSPQDRSFMRRSLAIDDTCLVFGTVARLVPLKRVDQIILAFNNFLHITGADARLIIVGDGPERSRLETLVARENLGGKVFFLGYVQNIRGILSAFDIFVLFSEVEGMPLSLLEAMSCRRVCVASNVGGVGEALDNETGILLGQNAPTEELLNAMLKLSNTSSEERESIGDRARQRILKLYSLDTQMEQLQNVVLNSTSARCAIW